MTSTKESGKRRDNIKSQLTKMVEAFVAIGEIMQEVPHKSHGMAHRSLKPHGTVGEHIMHTKQGIGRYGSIMARCLVNGKVYEIDITEYPEKLYKF